MKFIAAMSLISIIFMVVFVVLTYYGGMFLCVELAMCH